MAGVCFGCGKPFSRDKVWCELPSAVRKANPTLGADVGCHKGCAGALRARASQQLRAPAPATPVALGTRSQPAQRPASPPRKGYGGWAAAGARDVENAAPDKRSRTCGPSSSSSAAMQPLSAAHQALAAAFGGAGLQPREGRQPEASDEQQRDAVDETARRQGGKQRPQPEETAEAILLDETSEELMFARPTGQQLGGMVMAARFAAEAEANGRQPRRRLTPEERVAVGSACPWRDLSAEERLVRGKAESQARQALVRGSSRRSSRRWRRCRRRASWTWQSSGSFDSTSGRPSALPRSGPRRQRRTRARRSTPSSARASCASRIASSAPWTALAPRLPSLWSDPSAARTPSLKCHCRCLTERPLRTATLPARAHCQTRVGRPWVVVVGRGGRGMYGIG